MSLQEITGVIGYHQEGFNGDSLQGLYHGRPTDIQIDAEMIRRVLINLLENAIKYSRTEGRISVALEQLETDLKVEVSDDGPGISPEDQERIFEKFARVQSRGRPKGLGLGLAFCRLAIEEHGGKIWVESRPGQGSTFYFTLPK